MTAATALGEAQAMAPSDALVVELGARVREAAGKANTAPQANTGPAARASAAGPAAPLIVPVPLAGPVIPAPPAPDVPGAAVGGAGPDVPSSPVALAARRADEGEIRRVLDAYRRAVETGDLAMARAAKPTATAEELQRVKAAVDRGPRGLNMVKVDVLSLSDDRAVVRLGRPGPGGPVVRAQLVHLARREGAWIIVDTPR